MKWDMYVNLSAYKKANKRIGFCTLANDVFRDLLNILIGLIELILRYL